MQQQGMQQQILAGLRSPKSYSIFLWTWFALAVLGLVVTLINLPLGEGLNQRLQLHLAYNALLLVPAGLALMNRSRYAPRVLVALSWSGALMGAHLFHGFTWGHMLQTRMWGAWVRDATGPLLMLTIFAILGCWATLAVNRNTLPALSSQTSQ